MAVRVPSHHGPLSHELRSSSIRSSSCPVQVSAGHRTPLSSFPLSFFENPSAESPTDAGLSALVKVGGMKCEVKVAQSCLTLCNPMDHTVRGILQARILE